MKLDRERLETLLDNPRLDPRGTNLYAKCPYCGHDEFGISLEDNHLFNCFRKAHCGVTGNIYTLLSFLGKTKEFVGERQINIFSKLESFLKEFDLQQGDVIQDLPQITPPLFWKRVTDDVYLRQRGFADYQFSKFEVGRSKLKKDYVTFLVRQHGKLIGYVGRSEKSKKEIDRINELRRSRGKKDYLRYNNSITNFSLTLFGLDEIVDNVTTDVILTEGIFSKTKTDLNLGLDFQEQMKCCATLGAKLSDYQMLLLKAKGVRRLVFWFEPDVLEKIKTIVAKASTQFEVLVCYLGDNDPNDFNQQQALDTLQGAQDWLDFNTSYVTSNLKY